MKSQTNRTKFKRENPKLFKAMLDLEISITKLNKLAEESTAITENILAITLDPEAEQAEMDYMDSINAQVNDGEGK